MAHLYKASIWQGGSKLWYVSDIEDLGGHSGRWWVPCRILGISPADYVQLLIDEFKVSNIGYNKEKNFLYFSWEKESDARRYKNWINSMARKANYIF